MPINMRELVCKRPEWLDKKVLKTYTYKIEE